ncbi:MAG TPA: ATP-binding cassette domain-containing protein [Anaerolineales bacterium]|nr:ATP-binding cassette domain-containing protein [Anaerolineales bacterium]
MHIELRQIRKYFGPVKANDGISLVFEGGRIYGLLGENGAGKSTLMKILSGYQPPDAGELLLDGQVQRFSSPAEALGSGIGMLYQDPLDFPPFNISDNYLLGRDRRVFLDYKTANRELREVMERYGFYLDLQANIESLSLGERQQLELVRLLIGGAQILILDEPTTGISAEQKEKLFASMRKLAHEEGKTLILVSHKLDEVQELCDHALVLRRGKLVGEIDIPCATEELVEMMFGQVPTRSERPGFKLGEAVLELRAVSIASYRLSMKDISLDLKAGEVFGLAGLEGSGQQLVLQACAGLLKPAHGSIKLAGQDIKGWTYHRCQAAGVAYVAAGRLEEGLVAGLTLVEHIELSHPKHKFFVDWTSARKETETRIERYQIVGRPDTLADELSGGNQQRLLFALLRSPLKLLLLEHPTRGLDVRSANWIWELLYQRREEGTAILFMSSDLDEVIERSDRIAVFSGGVMSRVVEAKKTSAEELGHLIGGQA